MFDFFNWLLLSYLKILLNMRFFQSSNFHQEQRRCDDKKIRLAERNRIKFLLYFLQKLFFHENYYL